MDLTAVLIALSAILLIYIVIKIYKYLQKPTLKSLGIAHPKALPIVGNMLPVFIGKRELLQLVDDWYKEFSHHKIFGFYNTFGQFNIMVADPDVIKQIAIKDFEYFVNRGPPLSDDIDRMFSRSLLLMHDQKWKDMRTLLNPVYTSSKIKQIYFMLRDCITDFIDFYEKKAKSNGGEVEVETHETFSRITADGIAASALGLKSDSTRNKESEIYKSANQIDEDFSNPINFLILAFAPFLFKLFKWQFFRKRLIDFFTETVLGEIKRRKANNIHKPDVIHQLIIAQDEKVKRNYGEAMVSGLRKWSDDDLVAQAFTMFLGGFQTTTGFMETTCYELAMNQDIQQTLIEEVDEMLTTLNGEEISYDQLNEMKFLDMVTSEALRKWPSVQIAQRICGKDYDLKTSDGKVYKIKKGTDFLFSFKTIHMDPKHFPNPEKFDPHRFSDENKANIVPGSYLPFGLVSLKFFVDFF